VLIGIATYNERENLPTLIERIRAHHSELDVLVVDDASPDGTGEWCREQARRLTQLACIQRPGKLGLGSAVQCMFRYAAEQHYEWLITMDADLSHDPAQLSRLLNALPDADVVVGSRYIEGGATVNWPLHRRWASWLTNCFVRWLLRLPLHDCSSGYRAYRVDVMSALDARPRWSSGYAFYEEVLWRLQCRQARFKEVPITFVDRVAGRSKVNSWQALRALCALLLLRFRG
jgi:dolichol-phosphate mannosyltransferase